MVEWLLDEIYETSAGKVAAGRGGDGPDLVLTHGWPWSSYAWHRVIPDLARHFRVHWYDMPGYGQSEKFDGQRSSLDVQANVFIEMLGHWQLQNPRVVAHDFGGAITLRAHLLHGCDFARYALMNVVAMRPWGSAFFDHVGKHVEAFQGLPPHIHRAIVEAYIKGAFANDIDTFDFENLVAPWLSEEGAASFYRQFAQADEKYTEQVEPYFKDIRCKTKIIWGEKDPWIPIKRGEALRDAIGHAKFTTLQNVGHMPQIEDTSAVRSELLNFL